VCKYINFRSRPISDIHTQTKGHPKVPLS